MACLNSGAGRKYSGIAKVRSGARNILAPPFNKKLQSLKWKIGTKVRKK